VEGDTLTAILVSGPAHGTLILNANGSFNYAPAAGYNGPDSFSYKANDGFADSAPATVSLTVIAADNNAPVAMADSYSTDEDAVLVVPAPGVSGNDTDVDGDALTALLGTLTLNAEGSFTYTPAENYNGSDSFTYKANDGLADSAPATVSLTVNAVNDAPVAVADSYSTNEDTPLVVATPAVLANDTDVDGDALTALLVSGPSHGTLTLNADGSLTYTPAQNYSGADSFSYKVTDGNLDSEIALVPIDVQPVNDAPEFVSQPVTSFTIDVPRTKANLDSVFEATGATGATVKVCFEWLDCEEGFRDEVGIYRVDDVDGTVDGIAPGDEDYESAALERAQVVYASGDRTRPKKELNLQGGALYAFYLIRNGSNGRHDDCGDPQTFFSIVEANSDGRDHMRAWFDSQGALKIDWEDLGDDDRHGDKDDDRHGDKDGHKHGGDDDHDGHGKGHDHHDPCDKPGNSGHGWIGHGHDGHHDDHDDRDRDAEMRVAGLRLPPQKAYVYDADAIDIDGDTLTYSLVTGPQGASIDASTGMVNWLPATAGRYHFVIRVEDGNGGADEQSFDVEVTRAERVLCVRGTDRNDQIEVSEDEGIIKVTVNRETRTYSGFTAIYVDARGGNDVVRLIDLTVNTLVDGGCGNDKIDGTRVNSAHLALFGDDGNDDLRGGDASDLLVGGDGNDQLRGGEGDDWLYGGDDHDILFGECGNDVLIGGDGNDNVKGGEGDDLLVRGRGCDRMDGGPGYDRTIDPSDLVGGWLYINVDELRSACRETPCSDHKPRCAPPSHHGSHSKHSRCYSKSKGHGGRC
jgi:VCBS repeat-containing protein